MVADPWRRATAPVVLDAEPTFKGVTGKYAWSASVTSADRQAFDAAVKAWRKRKLEAAARRTESEKFSDDLAKAGPCAFGDVGCYLSKFSGAVQDGLKNVALLALLGIAIYAAMPSIVRAIKK